MKVGYTYHVYNKELNADSVVKVIKVINKCYICKDIDSGNDFTMIFTEEILENCDLTVIDVDNYPTVVDNSDYRINVS